MVNLKIILGCFVLTTAGVFGQSIGTYQIESDLTHISMDDWNSGVYILKSGSKSYRFVNPK